MSEIKFPPIGEILRRRFQADTQPGLADSIVPVVVLENDRYEYSFCQGERRAVGEVFQTNTPGTVLFESQLWNPSQDTMIVVDSVSCLHSGLGTFGPSSILLGRFDVAQGTHASVESYLDSRWDRGAVLSNRPVGQVRTDINGVLGATEIGFLRFDFGVNIAGASFYGAFWPTPIVIAPQTGYQVYLTGQTANSNNVRVTWCWRERPMSSWERAQMSGA